MKKILAFILLCLLTSCSIEYKISHYKHPMKSTCIVGNKTF